jgi:hypothetical protein
VGRKENKRFVYALFWEYDHKVALVIFLIDYHLVTWPALALKKAKKLSVLLCSHTHRWTFVVIGKDVEKETRQIRPRSLLGLTTGVSTRQVSALL